MARREDIETAIWSDPDYVGLTPHAKLVYLWSFTNPRCGMAGLYKVMPAAMQMETGLTPKQAEAALTELEEGRFVFFDGRVLWVRSRVKHLRSKSDTIAKSIASDVASVGRHAYVPEFLNMYVGEQWLSTHLGPLVDPSMPPLEPQVGLQGLGKGRATTEQPQADVAREAPVKFNGRTVPRDRVTVATKILEDFNDREGTSYQPFTGSGKPSEPFKRILGAIIDRPHIGVELGARINEVCLAADRFWEGPAQPGNVWGPGVVDRNVAKAMGARGGVDAQSEAVRLKLLQGPKDSDKLREALKREGVA
jgi:hypothetical protein